MSHHDCIAYDPYQPAQGPQEALDGLWEVLRQRRSVRMFAEREVPEAVISRLIACACTAPSGANKQPWFFVCVKDPLMKRQIRLAAEKEERSFYESRANDEWREDLEPLGTGSEKAFLETAPWLIVLFKKIKADDDGQHYYVNESVGIAAGMFVAAAQMAGLSTLTYTPSPMSFLRDLLGRGKNERPFLVIPVGYAADACVVPVEAAKRKALDEVMKVV